MEMVAYLTILEVLAMSLHHLKGITTHKSCLTYYFVQEQPYLWVDLVVTHLLLP
jgi:hypothetical protein